FGTTQPELLLINPLFTNGWHHFSYVALASGIDIHPTYFAVYIIFCICIVVAQYYAARLNGYASIALIGFFVLFLALLSTKIILIIILAIGIITVIKSIKMISQTDIKKLAVGSIFIFLFLVLSALNPISLYREFQEINSANFQIRENTDYTNSTEIRLSLWWAGFKTVLQSNPIIGSGSGDTHLEMNRTLKAHNISNVLNSNDPHNQFLNTFISTGLIGLLLLLGCYFYPVRHAWLQENFLQLSFIGLVLLASLTESFLESQKGIAFFVLFQSLSLTRRKFPDSKIAAL
ncbi:MAG: O-antigen ligase family protein, partial [Cyclobacteriaceae bacterium]